LLDSLLQETRLYRVGEERLRRPNMEVMEVIEYGGPIWPVI